MTTSKASPRVTNRSAVTIFAPLDDRCCLKCTASQVNDILLLRFLHKRSRATVPDMREEFSGSYQNISLRLMRLMREGYVQKIYCRPLDGGRSFRKYYYYSINPEAIIPWNTCSETETASSR